MRLHVLQMTKNRNKCLFSFKATTKEQKEEENEKIKTGMCPYAHLTFYQTTKFLDGFKLKALADEN